MSNSEPYSTLEVQDYSQLPEVVDPERYQKQFVGSPPVQGQGQYVNGVSNPYPPAEGYYRPGVPLPAPTLAHSPVGPYDGNSTTTYQSTSGGLYDAQAAKLTYAQNGQPGQDGPPADSDHEKRKRKICGVAPFVFYLILGAVLLVILGAVIGGVVGATASKNSQNGEDGQNEQEQDAGGDNSTSKDGPLILGNSRLTSTNWTDPDGIVHRAVFFQDTYDALIACQWDSDSKKWAKTNISEGLAASTSPLNPVSGTPLASASIDDQGTDTFEVHLWYLDPTSHLKSVVRLQALDSSDLWKTDTLNNAILETRPGSLLAATWQRQSVDGDLGNWIVAYQRPSDGAVKVANSSHWDVSDVAVESDSVSDNSSLAIIPQRRGAFLDRLELVSQGLGAGATGSMELSNFDVTWDFGDRDILIDQIPIPSRTQHFAATMWDNWSNYLYLALLDGGEMSGNHFDGTSFNLIDKINFSGGPDRNFTAISTTADAMLYAISNDEILEYSVDTSFPSNMRFVGKVFPEE